MVTLATGCLNAVLYGALALWRGTAQASNDKFLVCALIVLEGALLSLLVRRNQRRVAALNQRMSTLERRLFEQSILQEISRSVHNLNIVDTLQNLVEVTTRVMGTGRTALLVADPEGRLNLAESVFSTWPGSRHFEADRLSLSEEAFVSVLSEGRPMFVNGGKADTAKGVGILAIPLTGSDGPIGVLALEHHAKAPVGPGDREMLRDLASTAVLAIENSRLHATVKRMADHDGLTDIYNHRYFQGQLRQELAKAKVAGYSLSLVMLDVDRFKVYNDQYGHQQGDWVLKSIARVLDREARASQGLAARYGGDEFSVMLPRKTRDEAVLCAHLLQEQVDLGTATTMDQLGCPTVTVSLGVATLPDDADDASSLIEAVDRAMYRAKSQGGGCVFSVV
jgi:diguanylate cyclase (GGDEF)-like protein